MHEVCVLRNLDHNVSNPVLIWATKYIVDSQPSITVYLIFINK